VSYPYFSPRYPPANSLLTLQMVACLDGEIIVTETSV